MGILSLWDRQTEAKTPIFLKVIVIIQIWFLLSGFMTASRGFFLGNEIRSGVAAGMLIGLGVQILLLIAIWNLRRWAVVAYLVLTVIGLLPGFVYDVEAAPGRMSRALLTVLVFRLITVVPALAYWNRMTWHSPTVHAGGSDLEDRQT